MYPKAVYELRYNIAERWDHDNRLPIVYSREEQVVSSTRLQNEMSASKTNVYTSLESRHVCHGSPFSWKK